MKILIVEDKIKAGDFFKRALVKAVFNLSLVY